jgi:hypothetical protein
MNPRDFRIAAALAGALLAASSARAQDQGGPDPEEVKKKVIEIERLMTSAEESLARSTDTRTAAEKAAEAAKKILDEKSKKETGKSSAELRKDAESGSKEAKETLERLTKSANEEATKAAEKINEVLKGGSAAGGAGQGVRELIEKVKGDGQGASEGIKWLLQRVRVTEGQPKGAPQKPDQSKEEKPQDKKPEKPEEPHSTDKKPESKTEPPHSPEFEKWIAELPPQVRKAYDTKDWDSIPPKWREMIRAWAEKLSKEDGKERR